MSPENAAIVTQAIDDLAKARAEWAVANSQCQPDYIANEDEVNHAYIELEKVLLHFLP